MTQWETDFLMAVVSLIATAFLYGLRYVFGILEAKTRQAKTTAMRDALLAAESDAERTIEMLVQAANQTVVAAAKEQNGGKLSESDAKRIKDEVLAKAKQILHLPAYRSSMTSRAALSRTWRICCRRRCCG
jgi:hypothetical protein